MIRVLHGDCLLLLPTLEADSIDAVVTDPPYHLQTYNHNGEQAGTGFMGEHWDGGDIAHRVETWAAVWRVMKPGAWLVAFGGTRTAHRMTCAIEDAGFEIRDTICWLYGDGWPKSHDISKAIDKAAGVERKVVLPVRARGGGTELLNKKNKATGYRPAGYQKGENVLDVTLPATPAAAQWYGWGTALKPGHEPIILARKPLIGTVAANVLAHGTGGINVDACRIEVEDRAAYAANASGDRGHADNRSRDMGFAMGCGKANDIGRWPANVVHDGSDEVMAAFAAFGERGASAPVMGTEPSAASNGDVTGPRNRVPGAFHADTGTAARFFYCAKAGADDRMGSKHPTIKPLALMDWLVKLVTPPKGTVLDPFAGSGSTLLAADRLRFNAIGIEQSDKYVADIKRRLHQDAGLFADVTT
jgi:site-specific DNA-methyltransferase (adenine-specific)